MGLVHLAAGVVIGLLDANDAHHAAARDAVTAARNEGHALAMAASAVAECLVGPYRHGKANVAIVRAFLERCPVEVVALDLETASLAARLRARHLTLCLPDALVIATAVNANADRLVTTDRKWPAARALHVKLDIVSL